MGTYSDYLDRRLDFASLAAERKVQLARIAAHRNRDILVIAADVTKGGAPIAIDYSDLMPVHDQLSNLSGSGGVDLVLETPGGSGETAEEIVRLLRGRYDDLAVIVPGCAKSAGTIMAMAADDILMGTLSALGPIDAQISWQGKVFSADAFIEGMNKIKREVAETGNLNKAYIPILQGISPGEIEHAQNALDFAKDLVTKWLVQFKFKNWTTHSTTETAVTEAERQTRAKEIADALCDQATWRTHGRSIKIADLEALQLRITNYEADLELADAIHRYYTLLRMTFETSVYKLVETTGSQVYRFLQPSGPPPALKSEDDGAIAVIDARCPKCGNDVKVQANLGSPKPLQPGLVPFPDDNRLQCPSCEGLIDLLSVRAQLEAQSKQRLAF